MSFPEHVIDINMTQAVIDSLSGGVAFDEEDTSQGSVSGGARSGASVFRGDGAAGRAAASHRTR